MKKWLVMLLLLCLLVPAQAEIVGETSSGEHIHAYTADNGQVIYFTALEDDPFIEKADVNFDGAEDLAVVVSAGVSNAFCEFFVFDGEKYVQASHDGMGYGVCNYRLYPEKGLVVSHANNGFAGALHENRIFRWEGTDLKMIAVSTAENYSKYEWYDDGYALRSYDNQLLVTVRVYNDQTDTWETTMEEIVSLEDDSWFEREEKALWQGL